MALVLTADASSYARLPIFEDAIEAFAALTTREALLSSCEALVRSHGLGDVVGVDVKHKHFDLPTGTLLVERQNVSDASAVMKPEASSDVVGTLTPCAFFFSEGGWQPHEYVLDSREAEVALETRAFAAARHGKAAQGATAQPPGRAAGCLGLGQQGPHRSSLHCLPPLPALHRASLKGIQGSRKTLMRSRQKEKECMCRLRKGHLWE